MGEQFGGVLAAAKTGTEWALTVLYREFQPGLLRYLRAQAPADGEDLAADVWLAAAAGLGRFEGEELGFRSWLFTIAHRRLVDLRRNKARQKALIDSLESSNRRNTASCEDEVLVTSSTEAALALIAQLPADQAEIVLLRVIGGLDAAEVGTMVGKTPGAVRVLQHRALERLARRLAEERRRSVTG